MNSKHYTPIENNHDAQLQSYITDSADGANIGEVREVAESSLMINAPGVSVPINVVYIVKCQCYRLRSKCDRTLCISNVVKAKYPYLNVEKGQNAQC